MRLPLAALAALALLAPADAQAIVEDPVTANLDADPVLERLMTEPVPDAYGFERHRVVLEDDCAGRTHRVHLSPAHDTIGVLKVVQADGDPERPEILVEGRSGASGRAGITRVLRYQAAAGECGRRRVLFSYSSTSPRPRPPRGTYVANYGVALRDFSARHRGREVRLQESLARDSRPAITARRQRVSHWRYSPGRERWVRYRSRVTRLG